MKLLPLYVDEKMLERRGACTSGQARFRRTFGEDEKVPLTLRNLRKAHRGGLPVGWLADTYNAAVGAYKHSDVGVCPACEFVARADTTESEWKAINDVRRIAQKRGFYA